MSKTATTWALMKSSWHVLMGDKTLLLFPVISGIACFLVLLTFVVPLLGVEAAQAAGVFRGGIEAVGLLVLFCYYLCNFFVIYYFNAALVDFVVGRLHGDAPTLGSSLRAAAQCLPQIAAWALISATLGVIVKFLEARVGWLGSIVLAVFGVAWTLVTYFAVPFIIVERKGALEAVGASKDLLAKTWGKQIVSGLGYGIIGFLLTLPALFVIVFAIAGLVISLGHFAAGWAMLAIIAVLYIVALGIVMSALQAIFGVVLFQYARTGKAPEGFAIDDLRGAIRPA